MKFVNLQWPSTQSKPSFAWNCRLLNLRVMRVGSVAACWNSTSSLIPFFLGKSLYCEDCYKILLNLEMSSFGQIQRMNRGMLPTQLAETGAKPANYPWKKSWKKSWRVWCLCMFVAVCSDFHAPSFSTATKPSSARMRQRFGFKLLVWFPNFLRGGFDLGPSSIIHVDPGFINPKAVSLGSCVSNSRFSRISPPNWTDSDLLFIWAWYEHDFLQPVDWPLTLRDDYHRTVLHFWELIATIVAIRDSVSSIFFCATATNTDWKSINTRPFPRSQRQNDLTSHNFPPSSCHCSKGDVSLFNMQKLGREIKSSHGWLDGRVS